MATSTASDHQHHDPLLGKAVGDRYVIERLIGRGGVGLVYLADDTHAASERKVVVKVLSPHWAEDRDAVARFDREALRMAQLDHPNVVKMYDHGHFEGRAYIVMEFIRGEPLRRYLNRRKRMALEEFLPVAAQILLGAGYVHDRGIMMRDIKPPNIMLCEQGGKANHVKMLDFGLAKLIEEDDEEVTKAHVIGTAAYMSPEQIKGEKIDVRVDVYALGVLFFLMLTGEQPIAGDNDAAVLINHVHGTPKSLAERMPKGHRFPPEVLALIESCLAKDPNDRPHDAGDMAKRLFELVAAPLLEQPKANTKTRAAAETYWATRMNTGPAAVAALESDTNDSAEWTRPLLRRAAKTGEAPLKLAEAEVASLREKITDPSNHPAKHPRPKQPQAKPRSATGSGLRPPPRSPTGSGLRPPPRSPTGSGLMSRPPPPPPPAPPPSFAPPSPASPSSVAARTTPLSSPPGSATIRVTAADAKEAVAKLEQELEALPAFVDPAESASDAAKTGRRSSVPQLGPADLDPDADESSDFLEIVDVDDDGDDDGSSDTMVPTVPSDPMGTDVLGLMAPMTMTAPQRAPDGGMRLGAIVAVAGLFALVLGGLTAYLVLGGQETPSSSAPAVAGPAEGAPAEGPSAPTPAAVATPATTGMVEVRALAGARVEVDGEDRGEVPVHVELPLGEHRVRVTAAGHHPWQTTIDVTAGANAAVKAELTPTEAAAPALAPAVKTDPKRPSTSKPKPGTSKPKPDPKGDSDTTEPAPKPKPKPKAEVFMDSSKGKDDGIFMPVGGK